MVHISFSNVVHSILCSNLLLLIMNHTTRPESGYEVASCCSYSWCSEFPARLHSLNSVTKPKRPFKPMQHVGTTSSNIVGHNMLSPFKHHVGTCWAVLDRVGRCWMKFDFCQTFHPTLANIYLRACALVAIHWYPISPRMSKRGHCDPRRHSARRKNRHFV